MDYEPTIARRVSNGMLRHVTIRQIREAEQIHETAPLTIEGTEVSSLMVVANIFTCSADGGDLRFNLDDGTGRMACRLRGQPVEWVFEDFAYVRVILKQCRIRTLFEATYLNIVIDPYEIFYHSLKVIQDSLLPSHLKYRKDDTSVNPKPAGAEEAEVTFNEVGTTSLQVTDPANDKGDDSLFGSHHRLRSSNRHVDPEPRVFEQQDMATIEPSSSRNVHSSTVGSYHTAYSHRSPSSEPLPTHYQNLPHQSQFKTLAKDSYGRATTKQSLPTHNRMNDPYGHLSILQRDIILCTNNALEQMRTRTPRSEWRNGVHIDEIVDRLHAKHTLTVHDISENIEFLINESYIFTTIDDEHYDVAVMSTVIQLGSHWPTFAGIKYLVIFGDSYSTVCYDLAQTRVPVALQPLGITYPGITWNEAEKPNWVGHLIAEDCPGPRYCPFHDEFGQDPEYMDSPLLVYDYARGGDTITGVQYQIRSMFLPKVGQKPSWAPWSAKTSLFVTWVGINDCAYSTNHSLAMKKLLELHQELYEAGARNFMFIDVPPINCSPAYPVAFSDTDRYIDWNLSLKETIKKLGSGHNDVTILLYSSFALFTKLLDNPDDYGFPPGDVRKGGGSIWFDHLHPTSRVHKCLSQDIGEFLSSVGKESEVPN